MLLPKRVKAQRNEQEINDQELLVIRLVMGLGICCRIERLHIVIVCDTEWYVTCQISTAVFGTDNPRRETLVCVCSI